MDSSDITKSEFDAQLYLLCIDAEEQDLDRQLYEHCEDVEIISFAETQQLETINVEEQCVCCGYSSATPPLIIHRPMNPLTFMCFEDDEEVIENSPDLFSFSLPVSLYSPTINNVTII